jgi:microcystin-dependent protein
MSSPYIGEIRMFGGNFAPVGWAFCNGATMPISENDALFNLIGTTYGGDGQETFNLPDLQGRFPLHQGTLQGTTFVIAEKAGVEQVTLTVQQIPVHTHAAKSDNVTNSGNSPTPSNRTWASQASTGVYVDPPNSSPAAQMNAGAMAATGGSQPHDNMMPFLCISFIISLFGIFPSQT